MKTKISLLSMYNIAKFETFPKDYGMRQYAIYCLTA